jgi:hypothetical protein
MAMMIKWVTAEGIKNPFMQNIASLFSTHTSKALIDNVKAELRFISINNIYTFPVTINTSEWDNSYVCSPFTAYITYAKEEVQHKIKSRFLIFFLKGLISILGGYLKSAKINKVVHVNNFMLSTNPYPNWKGEYIRELISFLTHAYPDHTIIFRSLNTLQHGPLLQTMKDANLLAVASRQVYMYTDSKVEFMKRNNNYQDQRLIRKQKLIYLSHLEMVEYLEEALHLYNLLYLEKYSYLNPQFTIEYFRACHKHEIIHFQGYKDSNNNLQAFAGLFVLEDTITSPLVGYNTLAAKEKSLYIHAIHLIHLYRFNSNKILNLSSGAPLFKRLRGGIPTIEYSAVYIKHLSVFRKSVFILLKCVSNSIGVPLLKKYEL